MVEAANGIKLYFDPDTIQSTQLLGYTRESGAAVYRIFYKNGSAEDMVDVYDALKK